MHLFILTIMKPCTWGARMGYTTSEFCEQNNFASWIIAFTFSVLFVALWPLLTNDVYKFDHPWWVKHVLDCYLANYCDWHGQSACRFWAGNPSLCHSRLIPDVPEGAQACTCRGMPFFICRGKPQFSNLGWVRTWQAPKLLVNSISGFIKQLLWCWKQDLHCTLLRCF